MILQTPSSVYADGIRFPEQRQKSTGVPDSHQLSRGHGVGVQPGQQMQLQNFNNLGMHAGDAAPMDPNPMDANPIEPNPRPEDTDPRMHFGFDAPPPNIGGMHSPASFVAVALM